jgi:hypothetical protein
VNNAWQESIKTTPFYLNYGLRPHTPIPAELPSKVPAAAKFSHEWQLTVLEALRFFVGAEQRDAAVQRKMEADVPLAQARANLSNAQARQKVQADKHRSEEPSFAEGTGVLLSTKNIQWKHPGARKLLPLWIGPFEILQKIGKVAYKLQLPEGMKMHNVIHVNLLKKFISGTGKVVPPPPAELISGYLEYEVERVIDHDPK